MRERFVPAAIDQHIHRKLDNAEGVLFAKVLKQAGRGLEGRSQGVYIFHPDGTLLTFANTADADPVKRLMAEALATYEPGTFEATPSPEEPSAGHRHAPPEDVAIALVTSRVLGGYDERVEMHAASLGLDHLWIRADEVKTLAEGTFPESLRKRILRFHLVDNTRGEPPFWSESEIRESDFELHEGVLTGSVVLRTDDQARGYTAELRGHVEAQDDRLTRFDLVAKGRFQGEGRFTRGAPRGEFPFAVAIRLIPSPGSNDRVVPGAARGSIRSYLR